ncbi:hypothetical protein BRADI_2g27862v3 [Brachypodium distachyon]|uniref:Uncharacterized protein n=1 Tax=Brachypodium distachyon TaxID=15368 RepID=A0A0Q3J1X6_BRADI|nr:hypothetical protein BRADI_2g27862v3 [Brachypodium distachyon]
MEGNKPADAELIEREVHDRNLVRIGGLVRANIREDEKGWLPIWMVCNPLEYTSLTECAKSKVLIEAIRSQQINPGQHKLWSFVSPFFFVQLGPEAQAMVWKLSTSRLARRQGRFDIEGSWKMITPDEVDQVKKLQHKPTDDVPAHMRDVDYNDLESIKEIAEKIFDLLTLGISLFGRTTKLDWGYKTEDCSSPRRMPCFFS